MATTAIRYAASATYGSEAYDLTKLPGFNEPEEQVLEVPGRQEQLRERLAQRARAREEAQALEYAKRQVFGFPLLAIVGGIAAAVLLVTVLMGYIKLASISGEISQVRSSIEELTLKDEALSLQYESAFDMDAIETYAVNILGMTKLDPENGVTTVFYADKAEILAEDETADLGARILGFLKSIPEYFS